MNTAIEPYTISLMTSSYKTVPSIFFKPSLIRKVFDFGVSSVERVMVRLAMGSVKVAIIVVFARITIRIFGQQVTTKMANVQ